MSAPSLATRAVRAGIDTDPAFGAVVPPLVLSSNFSFDGFGRKRRYDYTRSGNPTRDAFASALTVSNPRCGCWPTPRGVLLGAKVYGPA